MHVTHIEKIIFAVAIIFLVMAGLVSVFVKVQLSYMKEVQKGSEELAPQISSPVVINVPEGWNEYRDEGLGYGFAYPSDWELSLEKLEKTLQKERQEQVTLQKDGVRILIDPLGRRGAQEFSNPAKSETINTNLIKWSHYWPSDSYHVFIDVDGFLKMKADPSTDGTQFIGGRDVPYKSRSNFKIHVNFPVGSHEMGNREVLGQLVQILETLTLI